MDVHFPVVFGARHDTYEHLLTDAPAGDAFRFGRYDSVEAASRIVQPLLDTPPHLWEYWAETWGPEQAPADTRQVAPGTHQPAD